MTVPTIDNHHYLGGRITSRVACSEYCRGLGQIQDQQIMTRSRHMHVYIDVHNNTIDAQLIINPHA